MSLTDKQLAGHQRRTLRTMRERLLRMADAWEGLDEYCRSRLTELADQAETMATEITPDEAQDGPK